MTYYVQDSGNITHLNNVSFEEAIYYIKMWAEERNLGAYYRHTFLENGNISIDYGSHTHIFYINQEDWYESI